ncbi:hypothetical protein EV193_103695 [Herbihabitans rhizosphaerae]|uniref:PE domain-containing protein n=1 Tax=Herbihabitans rhizosphaerae TaxID=1872711 RepID=A0A4Q7L043_9PSEU|nr:hypothetical protein [Herbihabitans rhizosphaerae]RZS41372.1 hypothetical protein EV193_103695 [Herbihabitans rhizosphaerae]
MGFEETPQERDDRINHRNVVAPPVPTDGSGGGYEFDLPTIDAAIREWTDFHGDLMYDARIAEAFLRVEGPGNEPASNGWAANARNSGELFMKGNLTVQEYAKKHIDALTAARQAYLAQDEANRARFRGGRH